jgi:hypothetical protein
MKPFCLLLAALSLLYTENAQAHQFSTAYVDVSEHGGQPVIVWQVALHDLAQAKLLVGVSGHAVRWQQVLDSEAVLSAYVSARIRFSAQAAACNVIPERAANWLLQQRQGEFYLQLKIAVECSTNRDWQLHYQALFDTEHSHKALLQWQVADASQHAVLEKRAPSFSQNIRQSPN